MKKKTARSRPRREQIRTAGTDHQLLAVLTYFYDGIGAERVRKLAAMATQILAEAPASFDGSREHPGVFERVTQDALTAYRRSGDKTHALALQQILSYGAEDITVTDSSVAFSALVRCVNDAALVGACLMYLMVKGGAR